MIGAASVQGQNMINLIGLGDQTGVETHRAERMRSKLTSTDALPCSAPCARLLALMIGSHGVRFGSTELAASARYGCLITCDWSAAASNSIS